MFFTDNDYDPLAGMDLMPYAQRNQAPRLSPEAEQALLSQIGTSLLSGASTLGSIIDTPASLVRNALAGENPFKGFFNPDQRTSGQDLLYQWGLADKDSLGGMLGGIGVDILLDPLTYMTLGGSALTKAGKVAKAAGLLENPVTTAAKLGVKAAGPRTARMGLLFDDLIQTADDFKKVRDAAQAAGINVADLLGQKLGSLGRVGIPFTDIGFNFGHAGSPVAEAVAKGLDITGAAVKNSLPVRMLRKPFDAWVMGSGSKEGQLWAPEIFNARIKGEAAAREEAMTMAQKLASNPAMSEWDDAALAAGRDAIRDASKAGADEKTIEQLWANLNAHMGPARSKAAREELEALRASGVAPDIVRAKSVQMSNPHDPEFLMGMLEGTRAMPEELRPILQASMEYNPGLLERLNSVGAKTADFADGMIDYWERQALGMGSKRAKLGRPFEPSRLYRNMEANDPFAKARQESYKGFKYGTEGLNDLLKDPEVANLAKAAKAGTAEPWELANLLDRKYVQGGLMRQSFKDGKTVYNQSDELAKRIIDDLPETVLGAGMFTNHPAVDMLMRAAKGEAKYATHSGILDMLAHGNVLKASEKDGMKLTEVFAKAGFEAEPALAELSRRSGLGVDALKQAFVKGDVAGDILSFADKIQAPSMNEWADFIGNLTSLWKGWVVTRPNFNVRNFVSGQINNMLHGQWSLRSMRDSWKLARGEEVQGLEKIPTIARMLTDEGLAHNPQNAEKMLARLAFAHEIVGKHSGDALQAGAEAEKGIKSLDELLGQLPGAEKFSFKDVAAQLAGGNADKLGMADKGTRWRDLLGIRGVSWGNNGIERAVSTHPLAAANESVGYMAEFANRMSPFVDLLRKGVSPEMAAARIRAAQVAYDAKYYTPLERIIYKYLLPFGKFSKGMAVSTFGQLLDNPGGPIGQTARAMNEARGKKEFVPDYLTRSLMIPAGGTPEAPRYLSGLGLMVEDPFQFAAGPRSFIQELVSRTTPLIKAPVEWATGRSFFQSGDSGGRALSDMDPLVGRLLANITGEKDANKNWLGNPKATQMAEQLLANSPLSPLLNITRTLTDDRKAPLAKALNVLTGFKLTDVPERTRDALIRETVDNLEREQFSGKAFTRVSIPKEELAKMSPQQRAMATLLMAEQNNLADRAKKRKKEAQQQAAMASLLAL